MLTLTENARTVIKTITDQAEEGAATGLRISPTAPDAPELDIAAVVEPESSDQVVEDQGACIYLEQTAAQALDQKVLDAQVDSNGAVQFSLFEQPEASGPEATG